ncbi:hypothetical protein ACWEO1_01140 [Kitasatospora cineracea]
MSSADLATSPSTPATAGMRWLADQTRDPEAAQAKWQTGRTVAVPVGAALVAVRVLNDRLGRAVFHALQAQAPHLLGPVISNQGIGAVEFLTAPRPAVWMGQGAALLDGNRDSTRYVQCPPLDLLASGRRWLNAPRSAPGAGLLLTDPLPLSRALAGTREQFARVGYPIT